MYSRSQWQHGKRGDVAKLAPEWQGQRPAHFSLVVFDGLQRHTLALIVLFDTRDHEILRVKP